MALQIVEGVHIRVVCNACGDTAELCAKREWPVVARTNAVARFKRAGWHHDARGTRARAVEAAERDGSGRWYCPACAQRSHL